MVVPSLLIGLILVVLNLAPVPAYSKPSNDCLEWAQNNKLSPQDEDCELKCNLLDSDMGSFHCLEECSTLCSENSKPIDKGLYIYYPGLTPAERDLVATFPRDAITVYFQKRAAENSSERQFPDQGSNEESDAYRHFIWAGLLANELGPRKARLFLDAHEKDPD